MLLGEFPKEKHPILVNLSCYNKNTRDWVFNKRVYFSGVLETGSGCQNGQVLVGPPFQFVDGCVLTISYMAGKGVMISCLLL